MSEAPKGSLEDWVKIEKADFTRSFHYIFKKLFKTIPKDAIELTYSHTEGFHATSEFEISPWVKVQFTKSAPVGPESDDCQTLDSEIHPTWSIELLCMKYDLRNLPYWESDFFFIVVNNANNEILSEDEIVLANISTSHFYEKDPSLLLGWDRSDSPVIDVPRPQDEFLPGGYYRHEMTPYDHNFLMRTLQYVQDYNVQW